MSERDEMAGILDAARAVLEALDRRAWHMAVAESCTGGGVGMALTAIPGSSRSFLGGVIAYDNRIKRDILSVPRRTLLEKGAVSAEVAEAMAVACKDQFGADLAIAVTGIAGPGGGTAEKPVGLVYIAVATHGPSLAERRVFAGDRETIRRRTVLAALRLAIRAIEGSP